MLMTENLEFNILTETTSHTGSTDHSQKNAKIIFEELLSPRSKRIHTEAITRAQRYLIAEAELLEIIIEVDKYKIYEEFGLTHLTPYCTKHLGLSEDVSANFVRVARKSTTVPELKDAINEGRLTVNKAKAIVSVITPENHSVWINKAETLTKDKLEKEVAIASPHAKKPERAKATGPDRVRFEFELSDEDSKLFRRAQDLVSQKLKRVATLAETQRELLKAYLEKHDPLKKAKRSQARSARKEKTCNQPQPVHMNQTLKPSQDRSPVSRSKTRPPIKAGVLHAVNLRDQGCCQAQLPNGLKCGRSRWIDVHHMVPVAEGGQDTAENLTTLCSSHHRMWHKRHDTPKPNAK